jgi:adenylate cyclase class 2
MQSSGSGREIEIKLRLPSAAAGRGLLERAGFRVLHPRTHDFDRIFDSADGALRARDCLLRVRQSGSRAVLTYKGAAAPGRHKSREELETELQDAGIAAEILGRLGFNPVFRYEKYRTEFAIPDQPGVAALDETPIGDFLELEGPPEWIDTTSGRLGFGQPDYITATYAQLYFEQCREKALKPKDMLFPENP